MKEKSYVEDIDRSVYDFKDDEKDAYKMQVCALIHNNQRMLKLSCSRRI